MMTVTGQQGQIILDHIAVHPQPIASTALSPRIVVLSGVRKTYGTSVAVDNIDLEIAAGEFFTFLGPSGSGKTTTLRLIAGFEAPDRGRVELAGPEVPGGPLRAREVA